MLQIFKDVAGADTVNRAWKCANPREIKNNWISLYDLDFQGAKVLVQNGGGGREGGTWPLSIGFYNWHEMLCKGCMITFQKE